MKFYIAKMKGQEKFTPLNFLLASEMIFCYTIILEAPLTIRGRQITHDDLTFIHSLIKDHWQRGRKFISQELCRYWQWYQPNGNLKDMACRELLLRLERLPAVGRNGPYPTSPTFIGCQQLQTKPLHSPLVVSNSTSFHPSAAI